MKLWLAKNVKQKSRTKVIENMRLESNLEANQLSYLCKLPSIQFMISISDINAIFKPLMILMKMKLKQNYSKYGLWTIG